MTDQTRLQLTLEAFDTANRHDPNHEVVDGQSQPREWVYGQRMSEMLASFAPAASEALQLAARSQHIERWAIPRTDYPTGRVGYNRWRTELGRYHARRASELMAQTGYGEATCQRVSDLLQKKQLKRDPETQTLEDVACLVFLRYYLEDFAKKHEDDKLISILQKTWQKMSESGQESAMQIPLSAKLQNILQQALEAD